MLLRSHGARPAPMSSHDAPATAKVPPKCHQNEKGKRRVFRARLQTIGSIEVFGSVTGARTRTLRLERAILVSFQHLLVA